MPTASRRSEEWDIVLKKTDSSSTFRKAPGIRSRIIIYLSLFVAFILLLLWMFQIVFLDDFYRGFKSRQVEDAAEMILQNLEQDSEDLSSSAGIIAEHYDVCILLLDSNANVLLSAEGTRNCLIHRLSSRALAWWCDKASEDGTASMELFRMQSIPSGPAGSLVDGTGTEVMSPPSKVSFQPSDQPNVSPLPVQAETSNGKYNKRDHRIRLMDQSEIQSLLYARKVHLSDGTEATLLLNTQINPVISTVSALRSQLGVITVVVIILAGLVAFLLTSHVSKPIIETNTAAKELSHAHYTKPPHSNKYREIAELNETLVHAADDLGKVEALQHELIANISHDLRTPLTMIGGYAEVMRDLPSENTPENMQMIIDETSRLSTLVNELLDFSRMQASGLKLNPSDFCLTDAVDSTVKRVGKLTEKDGYTILFEYDTPVFVTADSMRISQVVYNLIGNALTYTGPDKRVTVRQSVHDGYAHIDITDTGKGIAPDELDLIWNRYYRTKETHKRAIIGSGLGLNIVQSILNQHNVPYGVSSELDKGTTFWFELPLAKSHVSDENPR